MRIHPSVILVLLFAVGLIVLGIWLMFQGTDGAALAAASASGTADAISAPQEKANPAVLGFALITGGVIAGLIGLRKI